ncbi:MAG: Exodeoxyribonuclease 7 large subunit [Candidatus Saccharibacteria bacterium]|nr:Exodeoxyribonuclease 7 large subunit [Candidatus Saccharibacteria bacterium]
MREEIHSLSVSVSEFVALTNQTFEYAMPDIIISGELANLRVSKNKWIYFDLKDEGATVKFFGTVYQLPGPLEDGMLLNVRGMPRMHAQYGFSVTVQSITLAGEGTIRRAADLLLKQLDREGLFDPARKRLVPYPPASIGLVASSQSAAYADFTKIISARWGGIDMQLIDVQVQGEIAPAQIVAAIGQFNALAEPPEVLVLIRGGGSPEDLAAFSTEQVTRAVAASRIITVVAIGHEIDTSLAELAADLRASTPSNAAELLVPDRLSVQAELAEAARQLDYYGAAILRGAQDELLALADELAEITDDRLQREARNLQDQSRLLSALNPAAILRRGYAIVRTDGRALRSVAQLKPGQPLSLQLADGRAAATYTGIEEETHG